jgi:hypothetical protein
MNRNIVWQHTMCIIVGYLFPYSKFVKYCVDVVALVLNDIAPQFESPKDAIYTARLAATKDPTLGPRICTMFVSSDPMYAK